MKLRRRRRVKAFPQKRSQLGGCGLLPENGVWGHAPPSAFGRAAASPQTRQMRCWPPPTEVIKAPVKGNLCAYWEQQDSWRDLPSTAEKQDVSSAGFQGIFSPFTQRYSDIPVWGYHYPWRVLHAVETLGAQGTRWLNKLLVVYSLPVGSASAHSGSQGQTRGVFAA